MNNKEQLSEAVLESTTQSTEAIKGFIANSTNLIGSVFSKSVSFMKSFINTAKEKLSEAFNFVVGQFTETLSYVLGPLYDYLKQGINILMGTFGKIVGFFKKDESVTWLQKIFGFLKKKEKKDYAANIGKKKSFDITSILAMVAGGLGLIVGGITGYIIKPFQVLFNALKIVKPIFSAIFNLASSMIVFIKKIPGVAKIFSWIGKQFTVITKMFSKVSSIFSKVIGSLKILGSFAKGFMKGFSKLAWPLTAIMALFDFITAFMGTEGTIIDKIKAGISAAIVGFLEMPLKLIGWLTDKFLGMFGIEIEGGTGSKLIEGLKWFIDKSLNVILWPFKQLYKAFKSLIEWFSSEDKTSIFSTIWEGIKSYYGFLWDTIKAPFVWISDKFSELTEWFSNFSFGEAIGKLIDNIKSAMDWVGNKISSLASKLNPMNWFSDNDEEENVKKATKGKLSEDIKLDNDSLLGEIVSSVKIIEEILTKKYNGIKSNNVNDREYKQNSVSSANKTNTQLEGIKKGNEQVAQNQTAIINNNTTQKKQEVKRIPDESESFGVLVTNKATGW